jgi:predicted amidohydrolase
MLLYALLAQFTVTCSIDSNLESICSILDRSEPGDLVLFPEGCLSGYSTDLSFLENLDQRRLLQALELVRAEVRKHAVHAWIGTCLRERANWFNVAIGFTPSGREYLYRKVNLANHERGLFTGGSDLPLFELDLPAGIVPVGIQICRELRFPEQWGLLARRGAKVILHLNNAVGDDRYQSVWKSHLVSRAAEIQRFVLSANNAAPLQVCPSLAVTPDGLVLAEMVSPRFECVRIPLDLSQVSDWYLNQSRADVVSIHSAKES